MGTSQKIDFEVPLCTPDAVINRGIIIPNLGPSPFSSLQDPQQIDTNIGQQPASFQKYSFSELLTNLEISMRRTEMTRSAVLLNQSNSCYGSIPHHSIESETEFALHSNPIDIDNTVQTQAV